MISVSVGQGEHHSSESFASADESFGAPSTTATMDAIPAQMSAIFTTLVDDVQEQINELKQSQTSLLKEVDSIKSKQDHFQAAIEALPAWREALDEKINLMQAQYSMDELKSENRQLQGAVDAILEQHKYVTVAPFGTPC